MPTERIDPNLVHTTDLLMKKGLSLAARGDLRQAIHCFQEAVAHAPANDQAHFNLGLALKQTGDYHAAIRAYEAAARFAPNDAAIYFNWGNALMAAGDVQAAIDRYRTAARLRPEAPDYVTNLAAGLQEAGDIVSAVTHFQTALSLEPQSADRQWNLSLALLKAGRYEAAWPLFESRLTKRRWRANYPHRYIQPRWQGEPFKGRHLLVHFEQGFGDTLQFMRYLPQVKALGGRVTLEVPEPLLTLVENMPCVDAVVPFSYEKPADVGADLMVPLMSLAGIFSTHSETIPAQFPYLHAPGGRVMKWEPVRHPPMFNIGLVWSGKDTDPLRACGIEDLKPLLGLSGIHWVVLQKGAAAEDLKNRSIGTHIRNLGPELVDFADTAAVIHHLDLVVSVDTAVAHLAGAMGKPVFCLLRFAADWRWTAAGKGALWYPSMRLFRQANPGEWSAPVRELAAAIIEIQARRQTAAHTVPAEPTGSGAPLEKDTDLFCEQLFRIGVKQSADGELKAAIATYERLLVSCPDHLLALFNLGLCYRQGGEMDAARKAYETAVTISPDFIDGQYNLANLHLSEKQLPEAIARYERVLELEPAHRDALLNLSHALGEDGQDERAPGHLKTALAHWPESPAVHHQMGQLHSRRGNWPEAVEHFRVAAEGTIENTNYRYNLGHALFQMARFNEAAAVFRTVVSDDPRHVAAMVNLGNALKETGAVDEAETWFLEALRAAPERVETRWNLALIQLLKGDYLTAWPDFEMRWEKPNWRTSYPFRLDLPRWRGQSLTGKTLFVHDEQGFGDVLQFARYLSLLKSHGGRILFETREPLARLCVESELADEVLLRGESPHLPEGCDYTIPLMSLPGVFGHSVDQIPDRVPYLTPPQACIRRWVDALPQSRTKVGLVWSGRPTHAHEAPGLRGRSCGHAVLKPLIDGYPEICFVGIQQGGAADEATEVGLGIKNFGGELSDFADTAGLITHLDLVITVDTAVAHLAGAMGKPVWILLQHVGDWRWLRGRSDSPYYPSARLFRQTKPGDWSSVIAQLTTIFSMAVSRR